MVEHLLQRLKDKPNFVLQTEFSVRVSCQCIANHLDLELYTIKELRCELDSTNSEINIEKRRDELHGSSKKGKRASVMCLLLKGQFALYWCGLPLMFETHHGSLKGDNFGRYLVKIVHNLVAVWIEKALLNIDNAPWHCRAEEQWLEAVRLANLPSTYNYQLLRMAPYSFACNPIEPYWSVLKTYIKSDFRRNLNNILAATREPGESLAAFRLRHIRATAHPNCHIGATIVNLNGFYSACKAIVSCSSSNSIPLSA